jgi:carbamoyl-phosphate synthase large subunit
MGAGETFCAEIVENMQLRNAAERLSRLTKHIANMDIDVILVKNVPYIIDMNARFGGGYPFSHIGGANLPKAIVQWLSCEKVEPETLQATPGIISQKRISIMKLDF